jgi:hypothetical protein
MTMKIISGILIILLAFLSMRVSAIVDGVESKTSAPVLVGKLVPTTPKVADFEDLYPHFQIDTMRLSPVTPKEGEFEEILPAGREDGIGVGR